MAKVEYQEAKKVSYAGYGDVLVTKDRHGFKSFLMITPSERGATYPFVLFDLVVNEKYNAFMNNESFYVGAELSSVMNGSRTILDVVSANDVVMKLNK